MQRIYTYDARVRDGDPFVLEVATALRRGDRVECDQGAYRVLYVVHARVAAALPLVLLDKDD